MPTPTITINNVNKRGKRLEVLADYAFTGTGGVVITYSAKSQDGVVLGPFPYTPSIAGKFSAGVDLGEGSWKISITVTPSNGTDPAATLDTPTYVRFARGFARVVMPKVGGAAAVSVPTAAAAVDEKLTKQYSQAINGAAQGSRRMAAANAIVAMGSAPVLRIFRNNEEIVRVKYSAALIAELNGDGDVVVRTPAFTSASIYKSASLSTGVWRFALQGYGPSGTLSELLGTVGAPNSGKQLILSESPAPGMGFASEFTFLLPRSIDGLV